MVFAVLNTFILRSASCLPLSESPALIQRSLYQKMHFAIEWFLVRYLSIFRFSNFYYKYFRSRVHICYAVRLLAGN